MGCRASRKKRVRDGLLTWYSYLSHHDLDQFIISSFTLPLHHVITAHLRFGGQSHNFKYFLPLFSKVWQYLGYCNHQHKAHLPNQTLNFQPDIGCNFLLVFVILSQVIPSFPFLQFHMPHPIFTKSCPNCSSLERCLYSKFS